MPYCESTFLDLRNVLPKYGRFPLKDFVCRKMGKIMDHLLPEVEISQLTTASTMVLDLSLFSAGCRGSSLPGKQVGHATDKSSFEVMNAWNSSIDLYHYYPIHVQV